ncbi:hypothetical protein AVEN_207625-1 [Araneus ventricosus]|uniref:Uncharacterized protein n=1 Tax=Araneus ventricosus TaxID=182803 RepID=A0A4Y2WCR4_ARAVE|nr:hypothetical protein AVEN_207625-1 [Araneus ventricosus]
MKKTFLKILQYAFVTINRKNKKYRKYYLLPLERRRYRFEKWSFLSYDRIFILLVNFVFLHIVTVVVGAFVPSVHRRIATDIEEITVKIVKPHQDDLQNFGIGFDKLSYKDIGPKRGESLGTMSGLLGG